MSCSACWETGTDLAQFGQFGQLGKRRKADADHAEELQLRVLVCQTLHLAGLTVLQHQLHHLEVKCNADELVALWARFIMDMLTCVAVETWRLVTIHSAQQTIHDIGFARTRWDFHKTFTKTKIKLKYDMTKFQLNRVRKHCRGILKCVMTCINNFHALAVELHYKMQNIYICIYMVSQKKMYTHFK